MYINYEFYIDCDVMDVGYSNRTEPSYSRQRTCVDYDFKHEITIDDFISYTAPYGYKDWTVEQKDAFKKALIAVWESSWFCIDDLEEDENFCGFIKELYKDEAYEQCEREYN